MIKARCDHSLTACTAGIFEGIGSLAGVAEYVFAAFGDCSSEVPMNTECGENVAALIGDLATIAARSITVKHDCTGSSHFKPDSVEQHMFDQFGEGWSNALDEKNKKTIGNLETLLDAVTNIAPRK